ncbi:hypothetical protein AV521_20835 [Streptomyces sp. IMTB 2501]|nr:hypothetical protein AV521_20835 [Streptomyces sp. IMTB 2501]
MIGAATAEALPADIEDVVRQGVRALEAGARYSFDLRPQLVDLVSAITRVDEQLAVERAMGALGASPSRREPTTLVMTGDRQEGRLIPGVHANTQPPARGTLVRHGEATRLTQTTLAEEPTTDHGHHEGTA